MKAKEFKSKAICLLICCAIQLTWIVPLGIKSQMNNEPVVVETSTEENSECVLNTESEEEVVVVDKVENEIVMQPTEEEKVFVSVSFIPEEIQKLCFEIGEEYHIAPELLIAIIERESGGKVNAKNKTSGCMGLMQLHPKYAEYYLSKANATDPFNAEDNIRAGCEILIEKFEKYKDLPLVLMKYHGESNATSKYESGNYSKYCISIMERMEEMQEITGG